MTNMDEHDWHDGVGVKLTDHGFALLIEPNASGEVPASICGHQVLEAFERCLNDLQFTEAEEMAYFLESAARLHLALSNAMARCLRGCVDAFDRQDSEEDGQATHIPADEMRIRSEDIRAEAEKMLNDLEWPTDLDREAGEL